MVRLVLLLVCVHGTTGVAHAWTPLLLLLLLLVGTRVRVCCTCSPCMITRRCTAVHALPPLTAICEQSKVPFNCSSLCVAAAHHLQVVETSLTCCAFVSFLESVPLAPSCDYRCSNVPRMFSHANHAPVPTRLCVLIDLLRPACPPDYYSRHLLR